MTVYAPHFEKVRDRLWSLDTVIATNIGYTYLAVWREAGAEIAAAALRVYGKTIIKKIDKSFMRDTLYEVLIEFETDEDEAFFILQVPNITFDVSHLIGGCTV